MIKKDPALVLIQHPTVGILRYSLAILLALKTKKPILFETLTSLYESLRKNPNKEITMLIRRVNRQLILTEMSLLRGKNYISINEYFTNLD